MHSVSQTLSAALAFALYALPLIAAQGTSFAADSKNTAAQQLADATLVDGPVGGITTLAACKSHCLSNSACTMSVFLPGAQQCFSFGPGSATFEINQDWISSQKIAKTTGGAALAAADDNSSSSNTPTAETTSSVSTTVAPLATTTTTSNAVTGTTISDPLAASKGASRHRRDVAAGRKAQMKRVAQW